MKRRKKPNPQQLVAAINRHDAQLLRKLLGEGADPNAPVHDEYHGDIPVLVCAAGVQFVEGVKILLEAGTNPNGSMSGGLGAPGGTTALHRAISGSDNRAYNHPNRSTEEDRLRIVDMLLKAGADPNAIRDGEELPLYLAASDGRYQIVERLIAAGGYFKTWPQGCIPPLVAAAGGVPAHSVKEGRNQERVAKLLLDLGAPVDSEGLDGVTPLMAAAARGSERLVDLFLDHAADVNHRSKEGDTPMLFAALYAQRVAAEDEEDLALRIIKRLLAAGSDSTARNYEGQTAYDIAIRFRTSPAAEYLKKLCNAPG